MFKGGSANEETAVRQPAYFRFTGFTGSLVSLVHWFHWFTGFTGSLVHWLWFTSLVNPVYLVNIVDPAQWMQMFTAPVTVDVFCSMVNMQMREFVVCSLVILVLQ